MVEQIIGEHTPITLDSTLEPHKWQIATQFQQLLGQFLNNLDGISVLFRDDEHETPDLQTNSKLYQHPLVR